jgi:threonine/homoserine/homoserine lactone efflux protein
MTSVFLTLFVSSFVIALSGAMMPGTLLTVTISESSRRGMVAGPLLIVGHSLLEFTLIVGLLLGLAPLFEHPGFFIVVSLIGGGILLWMAVGMFRALPALTIAWDAQDTRRGNLILTGVLMSVANPYWIIWWATIGMVYITQSRTYGLAGLSVFFLGHILADFAWYALVSAAVGKGRAFFSDRIYRSVIGVCASVLVVFAALFLYRALAWALAHIITSSL